MHLQASKSNKATVLKVSASIQESETKSLRLSALNLCKLLLKQKRPETHWTKPLSHGPLQLSALQWQPADWVLSRLLNRYWFFYLLCYLPTFLFHPAETISVLSLLSHLHVCIPHPIRCGIPHRIPHTSQVKNYYHALRQPTKSISNNKISLKNSLLPLQIFWLLTLCNSRLFLFLCFRYITYYSKDKNEIYAKNNFNVNVSFLT